MEPGPAVWMAIYRTRVRVRLTHRPRRPRRFLAIGVPIAAAPFRATGENRAGSQDSRYSPVLAKETLSASLCAGPGSTRSAGTLGVGFRSGAAVSLGR